MVDGRHKTYGI